MADSTDDKPPFRPTNRDILPQRLLAIPPTISYEILTDDIKEFAAEQHKFHPSWRQHYYRRWARLVGLFAVLAVYAAILDLNQMALTVGLMALVILVSWPWLYRRQTQRMQSLIIKSGRNNGLLGPCAVAVAEPGLYVQTLGGESVYYWPTVEHVFEHKETLYLYVGAVTALPVPARVFGSPAEREQFVDLVNAHRQAAGEALERPS